MMKARQQNSATKRVFAGLLAVWMSGVVFLFCCGAPKVQAAAVENCPLAESNHCGKAADGDESSTGKNALRFETAQSDYPAVNCCGFLPQVFDKVRKAEPNHQIAEAPKQTIVEPPAFVFTKIESGAFAAYRPRPLNRSGTYLKNRAFRI